MPDAVEVEKEREPAHPSKGRALHHLSFLRVIERTIHDSPLDRIRQIEYTLYNASKKKLNLVYVPLKRFARNLSITDATGRRLDFLPNRLVVEALEELKTEDPEAHELFTHRFKHVAYPLAIVLPPDDLMAPGEIRTFFVSFESEFPAKFYPVWNWLFPGGFARSWFGAFFNIPRFVADVERFPGHDYDLVNVIVGPPGYTVRGTVRIRGKPPHETIYNNGLDDSSRVISSRLPAAAERSYGWNLEYRLLPARSSLLWTLVGFLFLNLAAGAAGLALAPAASPSIGGIIRAGAAAMITVSVAIIVSFHDSWLDRYKLLLAGVAALHAISWLVVGGPTAP